MMLIDGEEREEPRRRIAFSDRVATNRRVATQSPLKKRV
jgi:hypothetical protein